MYFYINVYYVTKCFSPSHSWRKEIETNRMYLIEIYAIFSGILKWSEGPTDRCYLNFSNLGIVRQLFFKCVSRLVDEMKTLKLNI